ncbi:MAG: SulP family inorganic anion transporter [Candidatus Moraniibacteriota bacterium]
MGGVIFLSYLLKLERYLVLVPASVIHGFTLGVALTIALGQFNFAFGLPDLPRHEKFLENMGESLGHLGEFSGSAFVVFLLFFVALFVFKSIHPNCLEPSFWLPSVSFSDTWGVPTSYRCVC